MLLSLVFFNHILDGEVLFHRVFTTRLVDDRRSWRIDIHLRALNRRYRFFLAFIYLVFKIAGFI